MYTVLGVYLFVSSTLEIQSEMKHKYTKQDLDWRLTLPKREVFRLTVTRGHRWVVAHLSIIVTQILHKLILFDIFTDGKVPLY